MVRKRCLLHLETRHTLDNSHAETSTTTSSKADRESKENRAVSARGEPTAGGGAVDGGNILAETIPTRKVCFQKGRETNSGISGNTIVCLTEQARGYFPRRISRRVRAVCGWFFYFTLLLSWRKYGFMMYVFTGGQAEGRKGTGLSLQHTAAFPGFGSLPPSLLLKVVGKAALLPQSMPSIGGTAPPKPSSPVT